MAQLSWRTGGSFNMAVDNGVTKLFGEIAFEIGLKHMMMGKLTHLDTTTLSVYGGYTDSNLQREEGMLSFEAQAEETRVAEEEAISLSLGVPDFGYAKNKRMDLKQMVLLLATTGKGGFPLWMEAHSGNASDKTTLQEACTRMHTFYQKLKEAPDGRLFVTDSAGYEGVFKEIGQIIMAFSRSRNA